MNCDACGRSAPEDEMIHFEGRSICAGCKPTFVQQLKEGCLAPVADALPEGFDERMMGFGELMAMSWKLLRRDWWPIAALTLLAAVPINLVLLAIGTEEAESFQDVSREFRIMSLLETVIGVLGSLGIAKVVSERLEGREIGLGGALMHAFRRWLPGIGTGILGNIIAGLLLLLLIVPGLIWMGYYSFSTVVVSLCDSGGKSALDYSKSLVHGRWWAVVGRLLVLGIVALMPMIPIHIGVAFLPPWRAFSFCSDLLTDLCYALLTVGTTVLFLNLDAIQRRLPRFIVPRLRR
jgi:hypothetical protein